MVAIPKKDDVVKLVKVSGMVPKGIVDLVEEQLRIKNEREGNTADLEFCLQFVMEAWGKEMQAENERATSGPRKRVGKVEVEAESQKNWPPHVAA